MKQLRCVFTAHYKGVYGGACWELGRVEIMLPEKEAYRLQNDKAGRLRVFMMHMPSAAEVLNDNVVIQVYPR